MQSAENLIKIRKAEKMFIIPGVRQEKRTYYFMVTDNQKDRAYDINLYPGKTEGAVDYSTAPYLLVF